MPASLHPCCRGNLRSIVYCAGLGLLLLGDEQTASCQSNTSLLSESRTVTCVGGVTETGKDMQSRDGSSCTTTRL